MSKHTPGPWTVNGFGGDFVVLARLSPHGVCVSANNPDRPVDEIANARLMATAPEMREMLRRVAQCIPDLDWTGMACCPFCESVPLAQPAKPCEFAALLAKVEGL